MVSIDDCKPELNDSNKFATNTINYNATTKQRINELKRWKQKKQKRLERSFVVLKVGIIWNLTV